MTDLRIDAKNKIDALYNGYNFGDSPYQNIKIDLKTANGGSPVYLARDMNEYNYFMAQDDIFNTPSSGVPAYLTTIWTNTVIEQLLQKYAFMQIAELYQQGNFESNNIAVPTLAGIVNPVPYSDSNVDGTASINLNFENRNIQRFQLNVTYGDLEVATLSTAKINAVMEKQKRVALGLAQQQNQLGFYGYEVNGLKIYGILNDPALSATIPSPGTGTGGSSLWKNKTGDLIYNEILQYVNKLFQQIQNVYSITDADFKLQICLAPMNQASLASTSTLMANTVINMLKQALPNVEVITAPQYQVDDGSAGNLMQIWVKSINGQASILNTYSYQMKAHRIATSSSYYQQKFSAGLGGATIVYPMCGITVQGI
jgi:hypothetical protein